MMEDLSLHRSSKALNLNISELSEKELKTLSNLFIGKFVVLICVAQKNYKGQLSMNQLFQSYIASLLKTKRLYELEELCGSQLGLIPKDFKNFLNDI